MSVQSKPEQSCVLHAPRGATEPFRVWFLGDKEGQVWFFFPHYMEDISRNLKQFACGDLAKQGDCQV